MRPVKLKVMKMTGDWALEKVWEEDLEKENDTEFIEKRDNPYKNTNYNENLQY